MNNPTIGERLRHAMGAMTQEQLSEKSGVPQSTINRILNGNSLEPRRSNVAKLAQGMIKEHLTLLGDIEGAGQHAATTRPTVR